MLDDETIEKWRREAVQDTPWQGVVAEHKDNGRRLLTALDDLDKARAKWNFDDRGHVGSFGPTAVESVIPRAVEILGRTFAQLGLCAAVNGWRDAERRSDFIKISGPLFTWRQPYCLEQIRYLVGSGKTTRKIEGTNSTITEPDDRVQIYAEKIARGALQNYMYLGFDNALEEIDR